MLLESADTSLVIKLIHALDHPPINDLKFWLDIAQILSGLSSLVAIIISYIVLKKSLSQVKKDLILNSRPIILLFSEEYEINSKHNYFVEAHEMSRHSHIYRDYTNHDTFGKLKNFGKGPALNVQVQWVVIRSMTSMPFEEIEFITDEFSGVNDTIELKPTHLAEQETGYLQKVPHFQLLHNGKILQFFAGVIRIKYLDTIGNKYQSDHSFRLFAHDSHYRIIINEVSKIDRKEENEFYKLFKE